MQKTQDRNGLSSTQQGRSFLQQVLCTHHKSSCSQESALHQLLVASILLWRLMRLELARIYKTTVSFRRTIHVSLCWRLPVAHVDWIVDQNCSSPNPGDFVNNATLDNEYRDQYLQNKTGNASRRSACEVTTLADDCRPLDGRWCECSRLSSVDLTRPRRVQHAPRCQKCECDAESPSIA